MAYDENNVCMDILSVIFINHVSTFLYDSFVFYLIQIQGEFGRHAVNGFRYFLAESASYCTTNHGLPAPPSLLQCNALAGKGLFCCPSTVLSCDAL